MLIKLNGAASFLDVKESITQKLLTNLIITLNNATDRQRSLDVYGALMIAKQTQLGNY